MTTLHKFKLLATQCAVAGSPSRSPSPGHVFHIRRRKTLRHLLTRTVSRRRSQSSDAPPDCGKIAAADQVEKKAYLSHTLKDLFVSSPPPPPPPLEDNNQSNENVAVVERVRMPLRTNRVGAGTGRSMTGALRYRLLRRAWRPVLVPIPE